MSRGARQWFMLAFVAAFLALFLWGETGLPDFGDYHGAYGLLVNSVVHSERQVTNAVSALVFDYRGYDTLGEELILFISVVGVTALLREQRDEREEAPGEDELDQRPRPSDGLRALGVAVIGATLLIGIYVVAHGILTPGGGFQGGVILGAALIAVFLCGEYVTATRLEPAWWMEILESAGAAGLALLALGGMIAGGQFFHNFLYTGTTGLLNSGGTIEMGNVAVGIEVMGASVLLAAEFLQQNLMLRQR